MEHEQRRALLINRLLDELWSLGIRDGRVMDALRNVPREHFVPEHSLESAWSDNALPIGEQQTISQPFVVALMSECLGLNGQESVLEVGTGSGYHAAVLSKLVRSVISIERIPSLAALAAQRLVDLRCENVRVIVGDGAHGSPADAPFDRIIVTAGGPVIPAALLDQLNWQNGRLIMPVGTSSDQSLILVERRNGQQTRSDIAPVRFVPLITHITHTSDDYRTESSR